MRPIVVVGSLVVDLVAETEVRPRPGETVIGTGGGIYPGGKGLNQAIQVARLGGPVRLVGRIGADPFGRILLDAMARAGIPDEQVEIDPEAATALGHIVVDPEGQNSIVLLPGANARLTPVQIRRVTRWIAEARLLMLQLEVPMETNLEAARIATEHGVPILLDPAPVPTEPPRELIRMARVITPNEGEAAGLTGEPVRNLEEAKVAAGLLRELCPEVVITLGAQGALVADADGVHHLPPHPGPAVDSTGAGDAFAGALAVALVTGLGLREAAGMGNVAGALAAGRRGAAPSLPDRAELMATLGKLPEGFPG